MESSWHEMVFASLIRSFDGPNLQFYSLFFSFILSNVLPSGSLPLRSSSRTCFRDVDTTVLWWRYQ